MAIEPVKVVGSSTFGRYPTISAEKTVNMFISDNWLVNYAGYRKVLDVEDAPGRGLYHSIRGNFLIYVVGSSVYKISSFAGSITSQIIQSINSSQGEVYIAENLARQICIVDGISAYIYNYETGSFTQQPTTSDSFDFSPTHVSYINSFFLISPSPGDTNPQEWYVFQYDTDDTVIKVGAATAPDYVGGVFELQTKPDIVRAVVKIPGRGNNVLVMGSSVSEVWTQVGGESNFNRISSFNIDYGVVNRSTIASSDSFVCWLSQNENSAPVIMVCDGSSAQQLSSDGITYQLQEIQSPQDSTAFFYKQDGHVFYQLTFFNPADNLTLIYDFTTQKFFHITDDKSNFHPARDVVFYDEATYFASLSEGAIFEMSTNILDAVYEIGSSVGNAIPRIRVCNTLRAPTNAPFRVTSFEFLMEQGVNTYSGATPSCVGALVTEDGNEIVTEDGNQIYAESSSCAPNFNRPRVDMSMSKNGGITFSNIVGRYVNYQGEYRTRITWHRIGFCNAFTVQLRFWGLQRFVCNNGYIEVM